MTRRVRILALVTDAFGGYGGIAEYNRQFLTALSQVSFVEEIVVLPRHGQAKQETLPSRVRQLPAAFNKAAYAFSAVNLAVKNGPFDLVFCGHIAHSALAAVIARQRKLSLWLQLHGIDAWSCPHPVNRWGAEQSDLVTAVSRYTKRRVLEWASIRPERVRVLSNTVSDRYEPGPKSAQLIDQYGLQGKRILLTVSRISIHDRYKGHHRVVAVLPDLLREHPDLVYVIAGDGDGRERLERLAVERGVRDSVKFIGRVSDDHLVDLYRSVDVFVMPSTKEGFGIVFLEAMGSGAQVVGGNEDGSMDPLRDGVAGHAVSCDNRVELIEAIRSALANPRNNLHHVDIFRFPAFSRHCANLLKHCLAGAKH